MRHGILANMIRNLIIPGLLKTGSVCDNVLAVCDGCVNFYVLKSPQGLLCIDAGWSPRRILRGFNSLGLDIRDVAAVFVTHLHWDHARCIDLYPRAQVFVGEQEIRSTRRNSARTWEKVRDDQTVNTAGVAVRVLETPGHTSGSMSFLVDGRFLFTGDTIRLRRGEAFPFIPWFSWDRVALDLAIRKLARMDGLKCIFTAHTGFASDPMKAFCRWREKR